MINRRRFVKSGSTGFAAVAMSACGSPGPAREDVTDLADADALAQAMMVSRGDVTPAELLAAAVQRMEAVNDKINAVVTSAVPEAEALAASGRLTAGAMQGVPYLIKDLTDVAGVRTTYGCRGMLDNIATSDAPIVAAVKQAGANIFGKTNTPEYGLIGTTESLALGVCRNPWNLQHSPGGSSGGAAAAVAAGIVPVAQASDGGGSIRIPASCCGLVGLKPSRGRMAGEEQGMALSDLGVRHAVSRSVRDSAMLLAVSEGQNPAFEPVGFVARPLERKLKIAFSTTSAKGSVPDPDVLAAQQKTAALCQSLGHEVVEAAPAYDGRAFETAFLDLWSRGAFGIRQSFLDQGTAPADLHKVLEPWTLYLAEHFANLAPDRISNVMETFEQVRRVVTEFMLDFDVWLTPVLSSAPPVVGEQGPDVELEVLEQRTFDYVAYTPLANVLGTPAISLPMHWNDQNLPIGSMFTANSGNERLLLELAYQLEIAQPWAARRATL